MGMVNKRNLKKYASQCFLCDVKEYSLLDVHRIIAGEHGGTYDLSNCLILCSNCHRSVHSKKIEIIKKHKSHGKTLFSVEVIIGGKKKFLPCHY